MNKLSIGFSKPKTWKPLAELIMLIGGTSYSHTFVTWKCTAIDRRKVFEAVGSGIRIISNVTFKEHAEIVELYHFEVSDEKMIEIEQMAHDMAGTPYGTKALVGIGIMKVFNFFNKVFCLKGRQSNPYADGARSNVCIEAAGRILYKILDTALPDNIEGMELGEYNTITKESGKRVPQEKLDHINKKK
jgi:hypothetical protein